MLTLPVALRVLAIVQAGGQGSRMDVLTRERAKPALPFASTHALIDFPMSCLAAAPVTQVWVSVQYLSRSLDPLLSGGRPWDLDRTVDGFRRIVPEEGTGAAHDEGFSHGNADALFRVRDDIRDAAVDVVVVLSADHIFSIDLASVIARHLEREAECTLVTAEVGVQDARQKMVVHTGKGSLVTGVDDKPEKPTSGVVATEIFLYQPEVLISELERLRATVLAEGEPDDTDDTGLGDFGEHLVPALIKRGRTHADPIEGYWRDVGRPHAYLQAHRDLLAGRIDVFDHPDRPVRGAAHPGPPAWVGTEGALVDAMAGPGARVRGRVERSVLGPGVQVQPGAVVSDSVLLDDVVVESGAQVRTAIVDRGTVVGRNAVVGEALKGTRLSDDAITLVGADSRVGRGAVVPAGGRLEPGTSVESA
ncbi:glucose-1-phosphate adenylyltransferase family protein [Aestuariimicrobium ganziense]|uniref:glucose-1-phosphate adenylyltransferase family protein n=1 Tax=Aestuariimicrobium ganziense TaxID=2773677 RepID=UPI0019407208|nr:sugar phosphate nucleotidyltransferase [Aestuariimicrobium ganziense]